MAKNNIYIRSNNVVKNLEQVDGVIKKMSPKTPEQTKKIKTNLMTAGIVRVTLRFDDDSGWFVPADRTESWKKTLPEVSEDDKKSKKFILDDGIVKVGEKWAKISNNLMTFEELAKASYERIGQFFRVDYSYVGEEYRIHSKNSDGLTYQAEPEGSYKDFFNTLRISYSQIFDPKNSKVSVIPESGLDTKTGRFTLKQSTTVKKLLTEKKNKGMLNCYVIDEKDLTEKAKEYRDFFVTSDESVSIKRLKPADFEDTFTKNGELAKLNNKIKHKKFSSLKPVEVKKLLEIFEAKDPETAKSYGVKR